MHHMGQLFEVTAQNRRWPQGTAQWRSSISGRHLGWILWLGAWAQFSHQKRLHRAWSSKSFFIQFENKYALRMDSASWGVIERSALMLYTWASSCGQCRPGSGSGQLDKGGADAVTLGRRWHRHQRSNFEGFFHPSLMLLPAGLWLSLLLLTLFIPHPPWHLWVWFSRIVQCAGLSVLPFLLSVKPLSLFT